MATYAELYTLHSDTALRNRVRVAVAKKAQLILDEATPTEDEIKWARDALASPEGKAEAILGYVLAANSTATVAQIQGAPDATLQTHVNTAVDKLTTIAQG